MSKIVIFSLMLTWCSFLMAQPCTPDQSIQNAGIFPAKLDDAHLNVAYSQVIQFKAPLDTTAYVPQLGSTLPVTVDSIRILDVLGLPPAMSYECHNASCMVNGGKIGCLLISGTCNTPGGYPLRVIIKTSARAFINNIPIPQTKIDTNTRYGVFVNWPTGIAQVTENDQVAVYPNPAADYLSINGGVNSRLLSVTLYNLLGKKIHSQDLQADRYTHQIDISYLEKGMYSVEVNTQDGIMVKKFLKE
jgi:hypothetical protein